MTSNGIDRPPVQDEPRDDDDDDEMSVPPHSTQAEEAVLGAVLKRGLAIADVLPFLKPQHFYEARHRYIYAAMAALFERAAGIDYHTIAEELEQQGTYEQAGGLVYLSEVNLESGLLSVSVPDAFAWVFPGRASIHDTAAVAPVQLTSSPPGARIVYCI